MRVFNLEICTPSGMVNWNRLLSDLVYNKCYNFFIFVLDEFTGRVIGKRNNTSAQYGI